MRSYPNSAYSARNGNHIGCGVAEAAIALQLAKDLSHPITGTSTAVPPVDHIHRGDEPDV
jgi:hypothetical protein